MKCMDMSYTNSDQEYQEICDFLDALSKLDPNMLWESGRMNFWRYNVHSKKASDDPFFANNVHLWRSEEGKIVGLCITEYGEDDMFVEVMPDYHEIYPSMFRWILETWAASRKKVEIDIFGGDQTKIYWLEKSGFTFQSHYENKRFYDLDAIDLTYQLEDGFTIQAFSETNDFAGRIALVQSAFNNPRYGESNIKGLVNSPDYIDEYNLNVVSPEGQQVSYCIGWHERADEHNGYIEPVGTHADFRKRGFAKAVIRECFSRMKANGIKQVEIASMAEPNISNFLYDSLSPREKREVHRYSKSLS